MTTSRNPAWLDKVYNAQDKEELAAGYDAWAQEYDRDVTSVGYMIPAATNGFVARYTQPGDGPLLDAGAGTGLMGEMLQLLGYKDIVAFDLSSGMLEQARKKQVYRELHQMALGEPLDFPSDTFAATIASGVFTVGHAPADGLDELVRVTRPGGHIIFSIRVDTDLEQRIRAKQDELERAGRWKLVETTAIYQSMPLGEPEVRNQTFVYQVT